MIQQPKLFVDLEVPTLGLNTLLTRAEVLLSLHAYYASLKEHEAHVLNNVICSTLKEYIINC
jgi:hypothetical protein